ncbi:Nucleoside-diphosphate-sugar epimerase [Kushneria avicenniae]|uniref:Nucleoside-diphosphate-sugar epimerase n=1 Tax=Kushneria avicenniae TaxID=402385 RepID=A0A1I1K0H4_9GAMM|nr:SDR family oxidoreductase [Kushneria avicenniae]SFC51110.1 Nucleoside-diphosphate-sugar epimerase [Kushneria avicenniae]
MNKTILILGCGDVGTALGQRKLAQGYRVVGVRRHAEGLERSGIEALSMDINDVSSLEALPDADIVVYALSADRFEESAYQAAYVDGLDRVLSHYEARERAPQHVFFVSSTSVYGQQEGETVDEESVTEPQSFSGRLLVEAEQRLAKSVLPGTAVRFSGIYGPGRERLIGQVQEGRIAPKSPPMYSNRIHRDDCAGVLDFLIERAVSNEPLAPVYLGSDTESTPLHDVMMWLAARLNVEPSSTIQSPLRRRASKRCDSARLVEAGYHFEYPTFREGYAQVLKAAGVQVSEQA